MFNKDKLNRVMEERELNLSNVAKMCSIAYSTLRDIYTGKNKNPLANTLKKLADGLNVSYDYFVDDDVEALEEISPNLARTNKVIDKLIENGLIVNGELDDKTSKFLISLLEDEIKLKLKKRKEDNK